MSAPDALFGAIADEVTARVVRELRPILADIAKRLPSSYVTPSEAAKHLGIARQTVYDRLRDGTLPGKRVGERWLVDLAGVRVTSEADVSAAVRTVRR